MKKIYVINWIIMSILITVSVFSANKIIIIDDKYSEIENRIDTQKIIEDALKDELIIKEHEDYMEETKDIRNAQDLLMNKAREIAQTEDITIINQAIDRIDGKCETPIIKK